MVVEEFLAKILLEKFNLSLTNHLQEVSLFSPEIGLQARNVFDVLCLMEQELGKDLDPYYFVQNRDLTFRKIVKYFNDAPKTTSQN